ncbi:hypothetical protein T11_16415 [Trichinella zimbabwensis]|uniref:Uncharacterized protein n=1 Tax=Trichinella zimbabwensis TaxID=268475 RepID=A0A0V1HL67_9BILA|nr:hypothetical protein T11_16415 [Trichinella zimbabwensis]
MKYENSILACEQTSAERKMKFELKLESDDVAKFESAAIESSSQIIVQSWDRIALQAKGNQK